MNINSKKIILVKNEQDANSNIIIKYNNDDNSKDQEPSIAIEDDLIDGIVDDYSNQNNNIESQNLGSVEAGSVEAGSVEAGSVEAGSVEAGSVEAGSVEAGSVEAGSAEDGSAQDGSAQDGSAQDGSAQDVSAQDGSAGSDEIVSDENVSDENVSDENVSDENVSDENVSDENVSDENVSDEDGSSKVDQNLEKIDDTFINNNEKNSHNKNNKNSEESTITENENDSDDYLSLEKSISKNLVDISVDDIVFKKNIKVDEKNLYSKLLRKKLLELQTKAQDNGINISKIVNGKTKKKKKAELVEELILLEKNI